MSTTMLKREDNALQYGRSSISSPQTVAKLTSKTTAKLKAKKISVISLFSGCGGMDLGFLGGFDFLGKRYAKNPFNIMWANEINKWDHLKGLSYSVAVGTEKERKDALMKRATLYIINREIKDRFHFFIQYQFW